MDNTISNSLPDIPNIPLFLLIQLRCSTNNKNIEINQQSAEKHNEKYQESLKANSFINTLLCINHI